MSQSAVVPQQVCLQQPFEFINLPSYLSIYVLLNFSCRLLPPVAEDARVWLFGEVIAAKSSQLLLFERLMYCTRLLFTQISNKG